MGRNFANINLANPEACLAYQGSVGAKRELEPIFEEIERTTRPVIVLANIGPWEEYQGANMTALQQFSSHPKVSLIINGGYSFLQDWQHLTEFSSAQDHLAKNGFLVNSSCWDKVPGIIIASRDMTIVNPASAAVPHAA